MPRLRGAGRRGRHQLQDEDFVAEVKAATGGKGVNVILDMVGGDYVPREMKCLADEGRLVFIALLGGAKADDRPSKCCAGA